MDLFIVLGLKHGATESDIKRAYRRLARRFHPDINPGDREAAARFREIVEAYETLIDPDRRSRYESGHPVVDAPPAASGFEGFDFSRRGAEQAVTFGDLFADVLMERGSRRSAAERGADLHHEVTISFDEAFHGTTRGLTVTRRETCHLCAGSGRARAAAAPCVVCEGAGTVRSSRGHMVFSRRCTSCGGSGQQRPRSCEGCHGAGVDVRADAVKVGIPAGVTDGATLRVEGRGNAGTRGGAPGDLYLTVRVSPHAVFTRHQDDLYTVLDVAIHEAALGARITLAALDGEVKLRIPPGTQSGQRFRLRERGMPSVRGDRRGDLVVEVRLQLPSVLDERSKELLREFGRINADSARPSSPLTPPSPEGGDVPASAAGDRADRARAAAPALNEVRERP